MKRETKVAKKTAKKATLVKVTKKAPRAAAGRAKKVAKKTSGISAALRRVLPGAANVGRAVNAVVDDEEIRKTLADVRNALTEARNDRDAAVSRAQALSESLAAALNERDAARDALVAMTAANETLRDERNVAIRERNEAQTERDTAVKERDAAREAYDARVETEVETVEKVETTDERIAAAKTFLNDLEFHQPALAPIVRPVVARLDGDVATQSALDVLQAAFGDGQ